VVDVDQHRVDGHLAGALGRRRARRANRIKVPCRHSGQNHDHPEEDQPAVHGT
jgi:hypothetical protein